MHLTLFTVDLLHKLLSYLLGYLLINFKSCELRQTLASPAMKLMPPHDFQLLDYSGNSRAPKTLRFDSMWLTIQ